MSETVAGIAALYSRAVTLQDIVRAWIAHVVVTQKDVAARGKIKEATLSDIANGNVTDPHFSTVMKLAKGFDVTVDRFLAGPPQPETGYNRDDEVSPPSGVLEGLVSGPTRARTLREDAERAVTILSAAIDRERRREAIDPKTAGTRRGTTPDR